MENIMLESDSKDAEIKLIDFGLSLFYVKNRPFFNKCSELVGTMYSMSPQVIQRQYTDKADLWSCGVIAFMLLSNKLPFEGETTNAMAKKILKYEWDKEFHGEEWKEISSEAKQFISHLLSYDEDKRWDASQALRSSWLTKMRRPHEQTPDKHTINSVTNALIHSGNDGNFKKLAMQVIAYNSSVTDIQDLRRIFHQFDADNTGTIDFKEFRHALQKCNYRDEDIKKIFDGIDVNQTGVIDYTEFIAATLETRGVIEDEMIRVAFDKLDQNNSGYISKGDLCMILSEKCTAKDCDTMVDELMKDVDTDGDGQISYDEFLVLFRERHRQAISEECCRSQCCQAK
jgi:Ca2+-binding EF-hand superfamily protein